MTLTELSTKLTCRAREIRVGRLLEQVTDPRSDESRPRPRPLAEVIPAVRAVNMLAAFDLYYDWLLPTRAAEGVQS